MRRRIEPRSAAELNFGGWLQAELDKRGWNRLHFATEAGVRPSLVSKWCLNQRIPEPDSCDLIAETLGIDRDIVLAAANHRPRSAVAPGTIRAELIALLNHIPEEVLLFFLPALEPFTDRAVTDDLLRRFRERTREPVGYELTAKASGEVEFTKLTKKRAKKVECDDPPEHPRLDFSAPVGQFRK
jgi:transcriptional regulator with XRE-family HTH domain